MGSPRTLKRRQQRKARAAYRARQAHLRLHPEDATVIERMEATMRPHVEKMLREYLKPNPLLAYLKDRAGNYAGTYFITLPASLVPSLEYKK